MDNKKAHEILRDYFKSKYPAYPECDEVILGSELENAYLNAPCTNDFQLLDHLHRFLQAERDLLSYLLPLRIHPTSLTALHRLVDWIGKSR